MTDLQFCTVSDNCDLCGACVAACPLGVLTLGETKVELARPADCDGGAICESVCPRSAIQCSFVIVWDAPASEGE